MSAINSNIQGYAIGEIPAKGATTAEILLRGGGGGVPIQGLLDAQYIDSKTMSRRPGMQIKYLPYNYNGITGQLVTGGAYLFDTYENAQDYARWGNEEFIVESGHKFWNQPMFESHTAQVGKVVGAHNFAEVTQHAVARLQQWEYEGEDEDVEGMMREMYPRLKEEAEKQGATSVWVLVSPMAKRVGVELGFGRVGEKVDEESAKKNLQRVVEKDGLQAVLEEGELKAKLEKVVDKSSLLLTLWLPTSREKGGAELAIPWFPFIGDVTHEHL